MGERRKGGAESRVHASLSAGSSNQPCTRGTPSKSKIRDWSDFSKLSGLAWSVVSEAFMNGEGVKSYYRQKEIQEQG